MINTKKQLCARRIFNTHINMKYSPIKTIAKNLQFKSSYITLKINELILNITFLARSNATYSTSTLRKVYCLNFATSLKVLDLKHV